MSFRALLRDHLSSSLPTPTFVWLRNAQDLSEGCYTSWKDFLLLSSCTPCIQLSVYSHSFIVHSQVRFGVISMSVRSFQSLPCLNLMNEIQFLGIIFGGLLSILLWFEVSGMLVGFN